MKPGTANNNNNNTTLHHNMTMTNQLKPTKRPQSFVRHESILGEGSLSTEASVFRGRLDDYIMGKEIGKGAYAIVKQGTHKLLNIKVAIKVYEKVKLLDIQKKGSVKREIQILKRINHPNLVKLHEVIETTKQTLLIMELVEGTSLLTYLKNQPNRRLNDDICKVIMRQLIDGLAYLHENHICHRDIKLENIIIDEKLNIKIIDFGFGVYNPQNKLQAFFCGTPSYMPPEIVQKKDYIGNFADVWSLGILMFTLLCGSFPFRGKIYCLIIFSFE